jgi:hypothetical protein
MRLERREEKKKEWENLVIKSKARVFFYFPPVCCRAFPSSPRVPLPLPPLPLLPLSIPPTQKTKNQRIGPQEKKKKEVTFPLVKNKA